MKYFFDTNIFLRFLIPDNQQMFEDCRRLFNLIEKGKVKAIGSSYIFGEIVWVLQSFYRFPKSKIASALKTFVVRGIHLEDETNMMLAIQLFEKYPVKFIDCLIVSLPEIQKGKMTIVSYDKDFDTIGVKRV